MHRLWISLCCVVILLVINGTPPSFCVAATSLTELNLQGPEQQKKQQSEIEDDTRGSRNKRELDDSDDDVDKTKNDGPSEGKEWTYPVDLNDMSKYETDSLHSDDGNFNKDVTKRLRSFIGKRDWISQDVLDDDIEWPYQGDFSKEKRVRSFIGKRADIDKRVRSFIGKRVRSFIGKRNGEYDNGQENFYEKSLVEKRPRSFIGKRSDSYEEPAYVSAREIIRDFLDKHILEQDLDNLEDRQTFDNARYVVKRPRFFVGKRGMDKLVEMQKRLRSFLGKREDKRIRSFIGKRSDEFDASWMENEPEEHKRVRSFIGKRSGLENQMDMGSSLRAKRLRDFIGKRDNSYYVSKRLRSFIGRR